MRPGQRARLAGIAGHPHVARVGEPPAVQRVLLHRGDEEAPVGREGRVEMRALPFERLRRALDLRETTARRRCNGSRRADSPSAGRRGRARWSAPCQVLDLAGLVAGARPACRRSRRSSVRACASASIQRALLVGDLRALRRRRRSRTTRPSSPPVSSVSPSPIAARIARRRMRGEPLLRRPARRAARAPSAERQRRRLAEKGGGRRPRAPASSGRDDARSSEVVACASVIGDAPTSSRAGEKALARSRPRRARGR